MIQTADKCKHRFHTQCVKIRLCLPSRADAKSAITSCPVCGFKLSEDTERKLEKLSKLDNLDKLDKLNNLDNLDKLDKLDDLSAIATSLQSVNENMRKLMSSYQTLSENYNDLNKRVEMLEKGSTAEANRVLKQVEKAAEVIANNNLELRTLQLESSGLEDQFVMTGFPETQNEKLDEVVIALSELLNLTISKSKIELATRLGKPNNRLANAQRPRDILVKLDSKQQVDKFISGIKNAKETVTANLILPRDEIPKTQILIHRRYPPALYKLRTEIKKKFPKLPPKNVWIANSAVYVRTASDKPPIRLLPSTGMADISHQLA